MARSVVTEIVTAVAEAEDVGPTEFEYAVGEYIDLEAVEQLATHETASWTLSFELPDHEVTVTGDGAILVDGTTEHTWISGEQ